MNKKIIILLSAIIVNILLLFVAVKFYINKPNDIKSINQTKIISSCAKKGEAIGAADMPKKCCSELMPIGGGGWSGGNCALPAPPTGLAICSPCGNGKCEAEFGENECNCHGDCMSVKKILWKSTPQGDFVADTREPKEVCEKFQKENNMGNCKLLTYKVSQDGAECADGKSVAGCFACQFEC